jgi:3-hydroxyacyl-[acyl-carrier-protein] dehydratase
MPGVLMLQSLVEAAGWLWRLTTDFRHPVIVLREVRNIKYGTFMQPGRRMDVVVDLAKAEGDTATFKGKGTDDAGQQTVAAQFVLAGYSLSSRGTDGAEVDDQLQKHWKKRWALLTGRLRA